MPLAGNIRLAEWLEHWIEERAARKGLRPGTLTNYRTYLKHLAPLLPMQVSRLSPIHFRAFFQNLAHLSPSHRRHLYQFIRAALRDAVRVDLIPTNPMDAVDPPQGGQVRPSRAWMPEEVARFLEAAQGHRLYALFALMLSTGLRPGEALALRWEDWEGERLWVRHTLRRDGTLAPPKTPGSYGYLYLDAATQTLLANWKKRLEQERAQAEDWQEHGLVFPLRRGTPLDDHNVSRALDLLQTKAGITRITLHGLRHTYTSLALRAGLPPKVVSSRLRHKSVQITLQVYQKLMDEDLKQGAVGLDTLLHLQPGQTAPSTASKEWNKKAVQKGQE